MGDPVPRLELGRRGLRHGLRARRRQDHDRPAAPGPGPEEDVDAGPPAPHGPGSEPQRAAQRDDAGRAAGIPGRLQPAGPGGPPGAAGLTAANPPGGGPVTRPAPPHPPPPPPPPPPAGPSSRPVSPSEFASAFARYVPGGTTSWVTSTSCA